MGLMAQHMSSDMMAWIPLQKFVLQYFRMNPCWLGHSWLSKFPRHLSSRILDKLTVSVGLSVLALSVLGKRHCTAILKLSVPFSLRRTLRTSSGELKLFCPVVYEETPSPLLKIHICKFFLSCLEFLPSIERFHFPRCDFYIVAVSLASGEFLCRLRATVFLPNEMGTL